VGDHAGILGAVVFAFILFISKCLKDPALNSRFPGKQTCLSPSPYLLPLDPHAEKEHKSNLGLPSSPQREGKEKKESKEREKSSTIKGQTNL
jgi:hypothetical protein